MADKKAEKPEAKAETVTDNQLLDEQFPLSRRMGWPLLSHREPNIDLDKVSDTPLSSMLNLPLLSTPKSGSVSGHLVTDIPTPLSTRFGWPLLSSRKPDVDLSKVSDTPFSDAIGIPLLADSGTVTGASVGGGRSSSKSGGGSMSRFVRQIVTGEPQQS